MRQQSIKKVLTSIICISFSFQASIVLAQDSSVSAVMNTILSKQGINSEVSGEEPTKINTSKDAINTALDEALNSSDVNVVLEAREEEPMQQDTQSVSGSEPNAADQELVDDGKYNYIKHNSLRDTAKFDRNLPGTSNHILKTIEANPSLFAGVDVRLWLKQEGDVSGMGPQGFYEKDAEGKNHFIVSNSRSDRRQNTILDVWYERVIDVTKEDKIFNIDLMLFINAQGSGRTNFFREINVTVDWTQKNGDLAKVSFNKVIREVDLSETDFEIRVEVATQKILMIDRKSGITKVAPVTLGAIDGRAQIDGVVNSMTLLLPNSGGKYADFKFADSVIMKRNFWSNGGMQNTDSRTFPAYYKGRPFIAVIDRSRISELVKDERENYVMLSDDQVNYRDGYREIGFHYQIEDSGLVRGYESHGCLRLQDHDLYVVDSILNNGPKDFISVEVAIKINTEVAGVESSKIDSIYKRQPKYDQVVYSNRGSDNVVTCVNKPSYRVRFFGQYHTIADGDCLSKTYPTNDSIENVTNYLLGLSNTPPALKFWNNAQHPAVAFPYLEANMESIRLVKSELQTYQQVKELGTIGRLNLYNYMVRPDVIEYVNRHLNRGSNIDLNQDPNKWPGITLMDWDDIPLDSRDQAVTYKNEYDRSCVGRVKNPRSSTPRRLRPLIGNCQAYLNSLGPVLK